MSNTETQTQAQPLVRISPKTGKPVRAYKKRKPMAKKRGRPSKADTVRQYDSNLKMLGRAILEKDNALKTLSNKLKELEAYATNLKIEMLDQQAVINYLEKKFVK